MEPTSWSLGAFISGALQETVGGLFLLLILAVVPLMLAYFKSKKKRWATFAMDVVVGWVCLYVLLFGLPVMVTTSFAWWGYIVVAILLASYFFLDRRRGNQGGAFATNSDQQTQTLETQGPKLLKEVSYLWIAGNSILYSNIMDSEKSIGDEPQLWSLSIASQLLSYDVRAGEATGLRAEITYYHKNWQPLFGPILGCWVIGKGSGGAHTYLSADPITFGPQDSWSLAISIRMAEGQWPFGLGRESLPFLLWRNPAFELRSHYLLRIALKGDMIQQVLYCQVQCADAAIVKISSIEPPPRAD